MRMLLIASLAAISACTAAATPPVLAGAPDENVRAIEAAAPQTAASSAAAAPAARLAAAPERASTPVAHVRADVDCDVRVIRTSRGVRFEATALSDAGASGEYEFVVTKRDRGGSSDIVQGGEYDLIAGDTQSLGGAEISVERGGGYSARLVLRDADGVACSAEESR